MKEKLLYVAVGFLLAACLFLASGATEMPTSRYQISADGKGYAHVLDSSTGICKSFYDNEVVVCSFQENTRQVTRYSP